MIRPFCLLVILLVATPSTLVQIPSTKDWRGLSPLKSTRADVEQVMGKPDVNHENKLLIYYLADVVVSFGFTGNPQCSQKLSYQSWDVTTDTLTVIGVSLRQQVLISDSGIDFTRYFKKRGSSDLSEHYYYSHKEDGFSVEVGSRYIVAYIYEPSAKDTRVKCSVN